MGRRGKCVIAFVVQGRSGILARWGVTLLGAVKFFGLHSVEEEKENAFIVHYLWCEI